MRRRIVLLALLLPCFSTTAAAQICSGDAPFTERQIRLVTDILFNATIEAYNAGVVYGGKGAFVGVETGMTTYNGYMADAFTLAGTAGLQGSLGTEKRAQLCPVITAAFAFGPNDIDSTHQDYSEIDISLELDGGFIAARGKDVQLIPTASLTFGNALAKYSWANGGGYTDTESYGILAFGFGVILSDHASLKPSIAFPFGIKGASVTYGIRFAVKLAGWN